MLFSCKKLLEGLIWAMTAEKDDEKIIYSSCMNG